ncbi:hypothetical protein BKI52_17880 [marine bacterium AO1-C]|nr:hypothetical protein BKI52_17880 [marine bacterium AO1-C]
MKQMKNLLLVTITILLCINHLNAQTQQERPKITNNILVDLNNLLPQGKFQADVMNGVKQSDKLKEVTAKFQKGIQENYLWYIDYIKKHEGKTPIPYHPNFGISKAEYASLETLLNEVEIVSTGKISLTIIKQKGVINFKASGKFEVLEYIKVLPESNQIVIGDYKLSFRDTINVKTNNNGLKSKWQGYRWEYSLPADLNLDMLKDLTNLSYKYYKCSIGRLERNGKTFFKIRGQEINDGVKEINFEVVLMF